MILKNSIENPKNSMKVIIEAPSARPSQPPTDAEKNKNKKFEIKMNYSSTNYDCLNSLH
jgi:hypothetical protein